MAVADDQLILVPSDRDHANTAFATCHSHLILGAASYLGVSFADLMLALQWFY